MAKQLQLVNLIHNKQLLTGLSKFTRREHRCNSTTAPASKLKTMKEMPGLNYLPIIGPLHHFIPGIGKVGRTGNFFELFKTLEKEYGPIVKMEVFKGRRIVVLFEPEHYDKVFRAEESYSSRPGFESLVYYRTELRKSTYDGVYGLTTAEGAQWRDFRTKVNPALLMPKLVKLYTPTIAEVADDMVERIKKFKSDQKYISTQMHFEMTKYSLEAIAVIALGTRLGCLKDDLPDEHLATQLIKAVIDILQLSFELEFKPSLWKLYPTRNFKAMIKALDTQWSISEKFIEEAKTRIKDRGYELPNEDKSVIEKLLAVDQKVAVMMANEMLMAGIDTVAFTMMGLLYQLSINLDKQSKLREEIRSGASKTPYLRACVKEALRIRPVISGNMRRTTKEHIVGDYLLPIGVDVVSPNETLSKSEKYYPRPNDFIPERWIVDKYDPLYYGNAPTNVTQPFGFGVRSCIGRRIAELEIEMLTSKIVDNFEVSWEGPPIKVITKVTNSFVEPYNFKFKSIN